MGGRKHRVIDRDHIRSKRCQETCIGKHLIWPPCVDAGCKMLTRMTVNGHCIFKPIHCKDCKYRAKVITRHQSSLASTVGNAERTHRTMACNFDHSTKTPAALQHGVLHQLNAAFGHCRIG
jgi:hypothetical protein